MSEEVRDVLSSLNQGETVLNAKKTSRAVLMLGEPSAGKSALTHFIAGDDNLISKEARSGNRILKLRVQGDSLRSGTSSIYPQKVVDTEDGTVFYDLPEFRDDKTAGEDLASAYFTQRVITRVESVKLVFVVSESFISPDNIKEIRKFLTHATRLIKNSEIFKDSIALVVTQVDDASSEEDISSKIKSLQGQVTSKAKSRLLDALLENPKERVAIVRKSQTAGPNKSGTEGKREALRQLIWKNLKFVDVNEQDYGYDLTDSIQPMLPSLVQEINKSIANDVFYIGKQLIDFYREKENQSRDIDELRILFWSANEHVGQFLNLGALYPRDFIERIIRIMNDMKIVIPNQYLTSVLRFDHYLQFINKVSSQVMTNVPLETSSAFLELASYLKNSLSWYENLSNLQNIGLSSYKIQSNIAYYKGLAEPLVELGKGSLDSTTLNTELPKRMIQFMRDIERHEDIISIMKDVKVDRRKAELLFELIDISLENQSLRLCENNKLVIKGQFVKMSDIGDCDVPEVELFAKHKVFLDADFDKRGKEGKLTIIAPTWEVILSEGNERKIILDGKDETKKAAKETAESIGAGSAGRAGRPGGPGGPAGDFVGIGQEIILGTQLTISAKGGKGGPGQDGGNGVPGKDGAPPVTSVQDGLFKQQWKKDDNEYSCYDQTGNVIKSQHCTAHGKSGGSGGNGGDGGRGGFGGTEGYVRAVFLGYGTRDVNIINYPGEEGDPGNGGTGAAGGKKGEEKRVWVFNFKGAENVFTPKVKARDGERGTDGKSGNQREDNDNRKSPTRSLEYPRTSLKINTYKEFLRENIDNSLAKSQNFLQKLETSNEIIRLYDTIGLVGDMQSLENQFHDLEDKSSFLPYYENLLKRIDEYSQNLPPKEKDYEHKVVLGFLRSSAMTKIRDISSNNVSNNVLVINPKQHLKSVMENIIKPLLELKEAFRNNETRKDFLEPIENRIKEAENIVENVIGPEIDQQIGNINEEINNLIRNTLELQKKKEDEEKELIKKKQELGGQLALKAILGTVQIASQFLALAGPVGAMAGAAIGGASSIAQGLLDPSGSPSLTQVPAGVTKSLTSITNRLKENQEVFKQQLTDADIMLNELQSKDDDDTIAEIKTKIKTAKRTLDDEMSAGNVDDPESVDKMYSMRKDLDELLTKKKKILQKNQTASGQKTDQRLRYISKVQNLVDLGSAGLEFYNKIKKDMQAIDDVDESIKKAREQRAQLEEYERNIYRTMLPMIKGIDSSFKNLQSNSNGKSHAALDVSKWQVQSSFMDTKKKLKEMTEGYKSQGELSFLMDKVEMGMTTIVQIYDRIQDYKDKADLANFIAAISSSGENRIEDVALFDFLQLNILFNSLLTEYEKSLKAVKLSTFPFINRYINTNDDECEFKFEDDANSIREFTVIGHTVKCIKNKFSILLKELETDDNVLTSISQNTYRSTVYNLENYHKPFFTRAFDKNDELIIKLLEGQQVEFNADVTAYQVIREEQHAVKFNQIGINLQIADPAENAELKEVLDGFNVEMTHSGESRYRCGDRFYAINHERVVVSHSANNYTDPVFENEDSFRVRTGAAILSPYTSWKIHLVPKKGVSFDRLKKFRDSPMKLHLEGQGWYISQGNVEKSRICKNDLGLYYKQVARLEGGADSPADGDFTGMTLDEVDVRRRRRSVDQDELGELAGNATVSKSARISTATLQSLQGGGLGRRKRSVGEIDIKSTFAVQNATKTKEHRKTSEGSPQSTHLGELEGNATASKSSRISTAALQSLQGGGLGRRKHSVGEVDIISTLAVKNAMETKESRKTSEGIPRPSRFPNWLMSMIGGRRRRSVNQRDLSTDLVNSASADKITAQVSTTSHQPPINGGTLKSLTADDTPLGANKISYDAVNMASNLVLLDLLVRNPNWEKREKRSNMVRIERELAHNIAYRAHVPRSES